MATKTRPAPVRVMLSGILPTDQTAGRSDVTVGDYIIEQISAGVHPITAAGAAGVSPPEYMAWIREGQLALTRLNAGASWEQDFTPDQQEYALFAQRAVLSHSQQVAKLTVLSEQVARGGITTKTTRRKLVGGAVVEEVTTEAKTLPDPDMLKWRLEHLEPSVYGKRATLAITVADMTDTDVVRDLVADRMAAIIERFNPAAIEATATEVEDGHGE